MLIYAVYELVFSYGDINCTSLGLDFKTLEDCKDIFLMMSVHSVAVITFIIRKACLSEKNANYHNAVAVMKTVYTGLYLIGIAYI